MTAFRRATLLASSLSALLAVSATGVSAEAVTAWRQAQAETPPANETDAEKAAREKAAREKRRLERNQTEPQAAPPPAQPPAAGKPTDAAPQPGQDPAMRKRPTETSPQPESAPPQKPAIINGQPPAPPAPVTPPEKPKSKPAETPPPATEKTAPPPPPPPPEPPAAAKPAPPATEKSAQPPASDKPSPAPTPPASPPVRNEARPPLKPADTPPAATPPPAAPDHGPSGAVIPQRRNGNDAPPPNRDAAAPAKPDVAPAAEAQPFQREHRGWKFWRHRNAERRPTGPAPTNLNDLKNSRVERVEDGGKRIVIQEPGRTIVKQDNKVIIQSDENVRLKRVAPGAQIEQSAGGGTRSVIMRPGNAQIISETDRSGQLIRRYRRGADGRESIIIDNRRRDRFGRDLAIGVGVGAGVVAGAAIFDSLVRVSRPRVTIARDKYIVRSEAASDEDIYEALSAPPVERIDRRYTLDQVRATPYLRDRMRHVDLDDINFEFGSWDVQPSEYRKLARVARAMTRVIERNPNEVFMIEGYTDAVGSEVDNLTLSDRRAESVAVILTEHFQVPFENLTTQGFGENYLKIPTQAPERANRRVAARRITPLLSRGDDEPRRDDDDRRGDDDRDRYDRHRDDRDRYDRDRYDRDRYDRDDRR